MDKKKIVVCGATGNQGGAVVESLVNAQKWDVVAISRNPNSESARALNRKGATVVQADTENKGSLNQALENAYGVFGVTQPWSPDYKTCSQDKEVTQGRNIVDACKRADVKHLVFSTVFLFNKEKTGIPHVDGKLIIEDYLTQSGVPHTFLKPGSFMDNIGMDHFPVKKGRVRGFVAGDVKLPYIACKDIGEFAAIAFDKPESSMGKEIGMVGDFVSGKDLCEALSKLRGGERFKYSAIPKLMMRIFAKEFYMMRVEFEKFGRPPYPQIVFDTMESSRKTHPGVLNIEQYLRFRGYDTKGL